MITKNLITKLRTALLAVSLVVAGVGGAITPAVSAANTNPSGPLALAQQPTPPPTPPGVSSKDKLTVTTPQDYSVKGLPGKTSNVTAKTTTGSVHPLTACPSTCYFYASGTEAATPTPTGVYAAFSIKQPYLNSGDSHTLAELAVESADTHQAIEVGWTVDNTGVNGTDHTHPHLFVYHWVNGVPTCYNACGFVTYGTPSATPGQDLSTSVNTLKKFGIEYFSGVWWVSYDNGWVGYFPGTIWSGASPAATFTASGYNQLFGEVAAGSTTPCTDMGDGITASSTTATGGTTTGSAAIGNTTYVNGPATPNLFVHASSTLYTAYPLPGSTKTFYYGGPGSGGVTGGC